MQRGVDRRRGPTPTAPLRRKHRVIGSIAVKSLRGHSKLPDCFGGVDNRSVGQVARDGAQQ